MMAISGPSRRLVPRSAAAAFPSSAIFLSVLMMVVHVIDAAPIHFLVKRDIPGNVVIASSQTVATTNGSFADRERKEQFLQQQLFFHFDEGVLDHFLIDGELSYGEASLALQRIMEGAGTDGDRTRLSRVVPPTLLHALDEVTILGLRDGDAARLLGESRRLKHSQRLALFCRLVLGRMDGQGQERAAVDLRALMRNFTQLPAQSVEMAGFLGPDLFGGIEGEVVEGLVKAFPKRNKRLQILSLLPHDLRMELYSHNETDAKRPELYVRAPGVSCLDIANLTRSDVLDLLSTLNPFYHVNPNVPFPLALRQCLLDKLGPVGDLNATEIDIVGGFVLSAVSPDDLEPGSELATNVLREVNDLQVTSLLALFDRERAQALAMRKQEAIAGPLKYSLEHIDHFSDRLTREAVATWSPLDKLICPDAHGREGLHRDIEKAYGSPKNWKREHIEELGDLLIVFDQSELKEAPLREMAFALPTLLEQTQLNFKYQSCPVYTDDTRFTHVCEAWLMGDEGEKYTAAVANYKRFLLRVGQAVADEEAALAGRGLFASRHFPRAHEIEDLIREESDRTAVNNSPFSSTRQLHDKYFLYARLLLEHKFKQENFNATKERFRKKARTLVQGFIAKEEVGKHLPENVKEQIKNGQKPTHFLGIHKNMTEKEKQALRQESDQYLSDLLQLILESTNLTHVDFKKSKKEFCNDNPLVCGTEDGSGARSRYELHADKQLQALRDLYSPEPESPDSDDWYYYPELEAVRCDGLKHAAVMVEALDAELLEKWNATNLEHCIEVFGAAEWPLETKKAVWDMLKAEKIEDFTTKDSWTTRPRPEGKRTGLTPRRQIMLGNLLEAVIVSGDKDLLSLVVPSHLGTIEILGQFKFTKDVVDGIVRTILANSADALKTKLSNYDERLPSVMFMRFAVLGNLFCGLAPESISSIPENAVRHILMPIVARMTHCTNPVVLAELAKRTERLYGEASTWSPALVNSLGLVPLGLRSENMTVHIASAMTPEAVATLTRPQLEMMTLEQVEQLDPVGLAQMGANMKENNGSDVLVAELERQGGSTGTNKIKREVAMAMEKKLRRGFGHMFEEGALSSQLIGEEEEEEEEVVEEPNEEEHEHGHEHAAESKPEGSGAAAVAATGDTSFKMYMFYVYLVVDNVARILFSS